MTPVNDMPAERLKQIQVEGPNCRSARLQRGIAAVMRGETKEDMQANLKALDEDIQPGVRIHVNDLMAKIFAASRYCLSQPNPLMATRKFPVAFQRKLIELVKTRLNT